MVIDEAFGRGSDQSTRYALELFEKLGLQLLIVAETSLYMNRLVELLVVNPRERFGIELGCDYSIWDLEEEYTVDPSEFVSMGKATPFEGWKVNGRCLATVCDGKVVYKK